MITLEQARAALEAGKEPRVICRCGGHAEAQYGVITAVRSMFVSVRFDGREFPVSVGPEDLELAGAEAAPAPASRPLTGAAMITAERLRQIGAEGWAPEHDAHHEHGELARAAACYAQPPDFRAMVRARHGTVAQGWPWGESYWKPAPTRHRDHRVRELAKAGALIAAEIDRLLAAEVSP